MILKTFILFIFNLSLLSRVLFLLSRGLSLILRGLFDPSKQLAEFVAFLPF